MRRFLILFSLIFLISLVSAQINIGQITNSSKGVVIFYPQGSGITNPGANVTSVTGTGFISATPTTGDVIVSLTSSATQWFYNQTYSGSTYNASYIPYTGATQNIDLGNNNFIINGTTFFVNRDLARVGIGSTNITSPFQIANSDLGTAARINFNFGTGNRALNITNDGVINSFNTNSPTSGTAGIKLQTGGNNRFIIDGATGFIGIGTTTPSSILEVAGDINISTDSDELVFIDNNGKIQLTDGGGDANPSVNFDWAFGTNQANISIPFATRNTEGFIIGTSTDLPVSIRQNSISTIYIDATNEVGVGNGFTSPNFTFHSFAGGGNLKANTSLGQVAVYGSAGDTAVFNISDGDQIPGHTTSRQARIGILGVAATNASNVPQVGVAGFAYTRGGANIFSPAIGGLFAAEGKDLAATSSDVYGIYVSNVSRGNRSIGIYINNIHGRLATTSYGIYQPIGTPYNFLNGSLGIGTDSPSGRFHVANIPDADQVRFSGINARNSPTLIIETTGASGGSSGFNRGVLINYTGVAVNTRILEVYKDVQNASFVVDTNGVGIGTTAPSAKLEVLGNVNITGGNFTQSQGATCFKSVVNTSGRWVGAC